MNNSRNHFYWMVASFSTIAQAIGHHLLFGSTPIADNSCSGYGPLIWHPSNPITGLHSLNPYFVGLPRRHAQWNFKIFLRENTALKELNVNKYDKIKSYPFWSGVTVDFSRDQQFRLNQTSVCSYLKYFNKSDYCFFFC